MNRDRGSAPAAADVYRPFAPRATSFHGILERAGHRLKRYAVRYGDAPLAWESFEDGIAMALDALPEAQPADGRPGLGFLIAHRGRGADYLVLAWWDRQNELPIRVFVRNEGPWRPARESESVCVWDLEILWREREAYVETVLASESLEDGARFYLERSAVDA